MSKTIPNSNSWTYQRARIAALTRDRPADDPELLEAKRLCRFLKLEEHITKQLAMTPALTPVERRKLARLFR